jgi:type I restriction enzyme, S subunit
VGEWRRVRIGDFLHRAKSPVSLRDDEEYQLVTVRMHHKGVVLREKKKGKMIGSNMYRVKPGQFILSGIDARNGAFGVIPEELDGAIVTNDFWYFTVDDAVVSRDFFLWFTSTPLFLDACIKSSEGTTNRRRLQAERFYNFSFNFPGVSEQHRLAERFIAFDKTHSALKNEFEVQTTHLKQLRQAVLQEAVEGKLTTDWRKQHPLVKGDPQHDATALLAQIKTKKERLVEAGKLRKEKPLEPIAESEKPIDLPNSWVWSRLTEICDVQDPNPSHRMPKYVQSGIPFISPMNVNEKGEINFSIGKQVAEETYLLQCQTYSIMSNSFAFSRIGTIGLVFNLPLPQNYCLSHSLSVITPIQDENEFLMRLLSSATILRQATHGVTKNTVPDLGMKTIRSFVVPLPPLAEQQAIVARVDSLMATIDTLEAQVTERKEQAQMLMQAVLRKAFAG